MRWIKQIRLKSRPLPNTPVSLNNFEQSKIVLPDASNIIFKTLFLSVDPYMRCRFNQDTGVEYTKPFQISHPITSAAVVKVDYVNTDYGKEYNLQKDDILLEFFDSWPWQDYATENDILPERVKALQKLPNMTPSGISPSLFLGALGQTGVSGFFGILGELNQLSVFENAKTLKDFERPNENDTVIVSGAAGAVGSVVSQICKAKGAKVIGICGSDAKGEWLTRGLSKNSIDSYVNYKSPTFLKDLSKVLNGTLSTVYFDNVGGWLSDEIISNFMKEKGKVIICGQIDSYNTNKEYPPPLSGEAETIRREKEIIRDRYLVFNYEKYFDRSLEMLQNLVASEDILAEETIVDDLENAPKAFVDMMGGANRGKMIVRV